MTMTEKGKNLLIWKCHVTMTKKDAYISNEMQLQNQSLTFILKNKPLFSATSILFVHPWLTTLLLPWTNWLAPTMWTLARVKTDLDDFLGPKMTPTTWILNKVFKREDKNAEFRHKTLQREKLVSISLFQKEII